MEAEKAGNITVDQRDFRFGPFLLSARLRRLVRDDIPIKLTPRTFDILLYLIERAGQIVSREEILQNVWSNSIVEDGNLNVHISALRKLLGGNQGEPQFIATIPRKGYSFVALVEAGGEHAPSRTEHSIPTTNNEAYITYLKGRRLLRQLTTRSIKRALKYFQKAIELDPEFALAHVRVGLSYYYLNAYQQIDHKKALAEIRKSVDRAFEIDPGLPEAHTLRGIYKHVYEWDWESAEPDLRVGVELDPGSAFARCAYANALKICGRFDEARHQLEKTLEIDDPLSLSVNTLIGSLLFVERRFDECVAHLEEMLELHPTALLPTVLMAVCLEQLGDFGAAVTKLRDAYHLDQNPEVAAYLGEALARAGQKDEALSILAGIETADGTAPFQTFYLYLALRELDKAFAFAERSLRRREIGHLAIFIDPRSDAVRADPRFVSILKRMKFPVNGSK